MKKGSLVMLMLLVALVLSWGTRAGAQTYLGEFCWTVTFTENAGIPITPEPALLRMGVTHMGGAYYTLQGIGDPPGGPATIL